MTKLDSTGNPNVGELKYAQKDTLFTYQAYRTCYSVMPHCIE